jgi:hypothetical protein
MRSSSPGPEVSDSRLRAINNLTREKSAARARAHVPSSFVLYACVCHEFVFIVRARADRAVALARGGGLIRGSGGRYRPAGPGRPTPSAVGGGALETRVHGMHVMHMHVHAHVCVDPRAGPTGGGAPRLVSNS